MFSNLPSSIIKHNAVIHDCKKVDELKNIINKQKDQINSLTSQVDKLVKEVKDHSKVLLRKDTTPEYDKRLMEILGKYMLFMHRLVEGRYKTRELESHNITRMIGYNKKAGDSIVDAHTHDNVGDLQALTSVYGERHTIGFMFGTVPNTIPNANVIKSRRLGTR